MQIRRCLLQHRGYEVEGEDDSFVCAFHCVNDAVECAIQVQKELREAYWHPAILRCSLCEAVYGPGSTLLLQGPRAKIGMCTGKAHASRPCMRTGRRIYSGSIMNLSARVAAAAPGGHVLLNEHSMHALQQGRLSPEIAVAHWKDAQLKGIQKEVVIYQARDARMWDSGRSYDIEQLTLNRIAMLTSLTQPSFSNGEKTGTTSSSPSTQCIELE